MPILASEGKKRLERQEIQGFLTNTMGRGMKRPRLVIQPVLAIVLITLTLATCDSLALIFSSPELELLFEGTEIELAGSHDFGEVEVYLFGTPQLFTIQNRGVEDLLLPSGIMLEGADSAMFRIIIRHFQVDFKATLV